MPQGAHDVDPLNAYEPAPVPAPRPRRRGLHVGLFLATCVSTFAIQYLSGSGVGAALAYAGSIIGILLAHEMGHYIMCRRYRVAATLPYFIPMPISLFGTMGAVILMRGRIPDRRALFDVAVAGPIAGLVVAVPVLAIGLSLSQVTVVEPGMGFTLGEPLLLKWLSAIVVGTVPEGSDVMLHPVAFAGWAGLFVTALNLLPIGQLDGGHILYAMFGRVVVRYTLPMIALLALLAFATGYVGWAILAGLIALVTLRRPHPPTIHDGEPLDGRRFALGLVMLVVFVLCFTPRPFAFS